ncbi:MAG TPA: hypothetical protein VF669_13135 [Tepidisphaeraceae bacterium]|jgi:hypothetical protein
MFDDALAVSDLSHAMLVGLLGAIVGAVAMLIYWKISPQERLVALKGEMKDSRRALSAYAGTDVREVLRLAGRAIAPALRQLLLILAPTLLAAAPVIVTMILLRSSHMAFMIGAAVATLAMKFGFKIH